MGFFRVLIAVPIFSCLAWCSAIDWSQPRVPGELLAGPYVWDSPQAAEAYIENGAVPIAFNQVLRYVTLGVDETRIESAYDGLIASGAFVFVEPNWLGSLGDPVPEPRTWISFAAGLLLIELINRKAR